MPNGLTLMWKVIYILVVHRGERAAMRCYIYSDKSSKTEGAELGSTTMIC